MKGRLSYFLSSMILYLIIHTSIECQLLLAYQKAAYIQSINKGEVRAVFIISLAVKHERKTTIKETRNAC